MPDSSHSLSWKPGSPVVRESTKPMPIPAMVSAPSSHDGTSSARHRRYAKARRATPPSTNSTPM